MTERTLGDASHTPPHEPRTPVQRRYQRGTGAVTDGGRESRPEGATPDERAGQRPASTDAPEDDEEESAETMEDVDHTPREGDGVNHVYQRGTDRDE